MYDLISFQNLVSKFKIKEGNVVAHTSLLGFFQVIVCFMLSPDFQSRLFYGLILLSIFS